jgi:hypothetical protein
MRRAGRQIEQAAGGEGVCRELTAVHAALGNLLWRAARHGASQRHRPAPLELEPERVHLVVVMEPEPFASGTVDEEEKRGFFAARPHERHSQGDHQSHDAWQDLMDLWNEHGLASPQRGAQPTDASGTVVPTVRRDLKGQPDAHESDERGEVRSERAPRAITGEEETGRVGQAPTRAGERARAGEPRRQR